MATNERINPDEGRDGPTLRGFLLNASNKDGVLTINIPKTEEAKPKEIKINVE